MTEAGYMPPRIEEVAAPDVLTDALRFRRSMEIGTVGIVLFAPTGEILEANEAFLRMSGYDAEDVSAGRLRWTEMTPPEWKAVSKTALRQFLEDGSSVPYEKQYLRKDGTRFWVTVTSRKLSDLEGIAFVLDIAQRKEAEAHLHEARMQLERSDMQLQTITNAVPDLIAYVDPKLRFIRVNRAYSEFFGVSPEALIGRALREVLGSAYAAVERNLQQALAGEVQQVEATLSNAQGETRNVISQYVPDLTPEGHVLGVVIQATDITERRRTEQLLRTAEKLAAVGRLAASMAHEINNPLEAVTNLLFLARQSNDHSTTQTFLEQAETELRRVSAITNQTLRFHKQSTRSMAVSVQELFESTLGVYATRLLNGDVAVEQRLRRTETIVCFEGEIRQVLSNLISNGLDAMMGREARLVLRAGMATDWLTGRPGIQMTVADTGTGMSADTLSRLWEPFFSTKQIGGTGLGLWISRDIVERHAGRLRVRSREGRGTVFLLWLPLEAVGR